MDRYQLATLVEWAGTLETRKRLQKVVYLLQAAGCDLDVEYTLHHYGPYSSDVATLTDEMVRTGLLDEEEKPNAAGRSFSYQLSPRARSEVGKLRQDVNPPERLGPLSKHAYLAKALLKEPDLRKLELAATVAYFYQREPNRGWDAARSAAAKFKHLPQDGSSMRNAEQFARNTLKMG